MSRSIKPAAILLSGLCGLAVVPSVGAGQSNCSDCEECIYDRDLTYFRDDGGQVAWLYPQCENLDCEELIPCMGERLRLLRTR